MGLLDFIKEKKSTHMSQSTTSGVGKDLHLDWAAMTEEQGGFFSALTMSKNLHGAGLTFRCKTKDLQKKLCVSFSEKAYKHHFDVSKRYKVRFQFNNSIVLYAYMFPYKPRHAYIHDVVDEFIHNLFDSDTLKLQYLGNDNKKVTMKFSLKGATPAINASIARANEEHQAILQAEQESAEEADPKSQDA